MRLLDEAYSDFKKSCSEKHEKYLPEAAPAKFAAEKYYAFLKEQMLGRLHVHVASEALMKQQSGLAASPARSSSTSPCIAQKDSQCGMQKPVSVSEHSCSAQEKVQASNDSWTAHATIECGSSGSSFEGLEALLSGQGFDMTVLPAASVEYMSTLQILSAAAENLKCKFQGVLVACEDEPRETQTTQESPHKRKASSESNQAVDCMLLDKTGAIKATVWGTLATELCNIWRSIAEARMRGEALGQIVEFSKVRVVKLAKNAWNGEVLTRIYELSSIEAVGVETGTSIAMLSSPTAPNLISMSFSVPPAQRCVSSFQSIRSKLRGNFRVTLKGVICDLEDLNYSQAGNEKRMLDLVDHQGALISCCAMKHNVGSRALQNFQEVVLYFASGRGPKGSSPGLVYVMKDAVILPIGSPRLLSSPKSVHLQITAAD